MLSRCLLYPVLISLAVAALPLHLGATEEDRPAAKLDGVVITERQIAEVLESVGSATQAEKDAALDKIIANELIVRQAMREGLDRKPEVVGAIEAAKRKILAQAYLEARTQNIAEPSSVMVQAFYDEHPELFSERAVYELQEISIQVNTAQAVAVNDYYSKIETLNEMVEWLTVNGIPHTSNAAVKSAEELPADLLGPVSQLQSGQVIKVTTDFGIAILQLTGKRTESLTLSEARPAIVRALANQALDEQMGQEMSALKRTATIEYYPPYMPSN